jgi:hypothetical protein
MKINGQEITPTIIEWAKTLIASEPHLTRSEVGRRCCAEFGWRNPGGQLQEMSCRKALLTLHRRGALGLPAATRPGGRG